MNSELIRNSEKSVVISDGEKRDVTDFPELPEYLELENLEESIEGELDSIGSQDSNVVAEKIINFYNKYIKHAIEGIFTAGAIGVPVYYVWKFICMMFTYDSRDVIVSSLPFKVGIGMIIVYAVKDYIAKHYDLKEVLMNVLTKINNNKGAKLEREIELVRNRMRELEVIQESVQENRSKEVVTPVAQEEAQTPQFDIITFEQIDLMKKREILNRLREANKRNLYTHTISENNDMPRNRQK